MPIEWLQGAVDARCPVCGIAGEKRAVLTAEHVVQGTPRVTFLRCADCGAAFLDDLTPPDYGEETPEMLDYYVEQGAGIDLIVAPLMRVPPASVRRCLEIGCSFPFALDFARFTFGWNVLGVDPSPLAVQGAEALGVPVRHAYFDASLDVGPEPLDLVLCSEILEHVADPHSLLSSIRERLSPEGMLVLSTPNAAILRSDTEEGMLARALSPGFHLILYDASALERVLRMAGFEHIVIEESYETLRAFAACSVLRLQPPDPVSARSLLRKYLDARKREVPLDSALASGLAYRHFKECVNAGLYDEAIASREFLDHVMRERSVPLPFNLCSILFFSGILELNALGDPGKAAESFAASIDAGERLRASACPFAVFDGETEMLLRQSRKHLPMTLAASDPERALREIERLESMDLSQFPAELLEETRAETFDRLVNLGHADKAAQLFRRDRILIAERFIAPCARLAEVALPLDVIAREPLTRLQLVFIAANGEQRTTTMLRPQLSARDTLRLAFAPFNSAAGETFTIGAIDAGGDLDPQRIVESAGNRAPIVLECRGDDRAITVFRINNPSLRTAHWIDAFWCDAWGIYLRGWVHAYEHRVRALRLESAGRSARITVFADRPDLLDHYPEHEHVRHGGFAVYLACPPAHPVTLVLETDGGEAIVPLELPEGPVPPWPREENAGDTLSPLLRRFITLANARGGRVLQIGSRVPRGEDAIPPRDLLHGLIGLDIHPGCNVDLVGDAHVLSHFIRARSLDAILSSSVLEHIQAPWLVAGEMNRVLKVGGLVYHHVPSAWPGHAQPNDFWRFSSEGLRVLFGPSSGFEILEACDSARSAIIPSPDWRSDFLDMPTNPAMAMAEIIARKIEEIPPGAIAWPLTSSESEIRSHRYPLEGLRPRTRS